MLAPDKIEALRAKSESILNPVVEFLIRDIARRVAEAGQLTSTAQYEIWRAQNLGVSQYEVKKKVAELLQISQESAGKLFKQAAKTGYNYDLNQLPTARAIPFEENDVIQEIVSAAVSMANKELENITQTTGFVAPDGKFGSLTTAFRKACDFAFMQTSTGALDYNTAIRGALRGLRKSGIQTIEYKSGRHISVEAAVRQNVFGAMGIMQEKISHHNHDSFGADGWEISAHTASAPDHEPIQGKQYPDAEYQALNNSLVRRIGTLNCGHSAFPIIIGVSKPQYTPEELEKLRKDNETGITYEGKHYTTYEATQRQRMLERKIRKQKQNILMDEAAGDEEMLQNDQVKYQILEQEYKRFNKAAGFKNQYERMEITGFGPKQANAAEKEYKELAKKANSMYDTGNAEGNIEAYKRDVPIRKKIGTEELPLSLHEGRQNKHIPGTNEYNQYVQRLKEAGKHGPSRITVDVDTVKGLVDRYHGSGVLIFDKDGRWKQKERITVHPYNIGITVNEETGEEKETSVFTIHYSKNGYHIVPDYPDRKGEKAEQ